MRKRNQPGCSCCSYATLRVTVLGCNAIPLPGATVTASLSGSSYVGTTDGSGVADIAVPSNGTYTIDITYTAAPRFAPGVTSATVTTGGINTVTFGMAAAAGYFCQNWEGTGGTGDRDCLYPLTNTLHLTDPLYGAVTLTRSGTTWLGTKSVSYAACGACPAGTVTISYGVLATASGGPGTPPTPVLSLSYNRTAGCPNNGGSTQQEAFATLAPNALDCPPAFFAPLTYVADGNFRTHCSGTHDFTLTE